MGINWDFAVKEEDVYEKYRKALRVRKVQVSQSGGLIYPKKVVHT
jgi:hypothetical protein